MVAAFLIKAASAIIDHIPILFAIGVSVGMASDHDGTSALAGLVSFLMITTLLSTDAVAMYHTAKDSKKKSAAALLMAGALASFFTGITEPLEFSFMFLAPELYMVHAVLTGIAAVICTLLPMRLGFNFSAGLVDWILSFKAPMAVNPWMLIPVGLVYACVYYFVFRFVITKFNLKTPGREDDDDEEYYRALKRKSFYFDFVLSK